LVLGVDGEYVVKVTETDGAGNSGASASTFTLVTEEPGVPPAAPVISSPSGLINTGTPLVRGTGSKSGNTVSVRDGDGVTLCVATVQGDGAWSCQVSSRLVDGVHGLWAVEVDVVGNASGASAIVSVTVDTVAPPAPTISGPSGFVNASRPLISGVGAEPGNVVTVSAAGVTVCTAVVSLTGGWSCTAALADGGYALRAVEVDAAGNQSEPSRVVNVTIDTVAPGVPVLDVSSGFIVSGVAEPGATVSVRDVDGLLVAGCEAVVAGVDGRFECVPATPLEADVVVKVTATDRAGNVSAAAILVIAPIGIAMPSDTHGPSGEVVVRGYNFVPGELVQLVIHSDPFEVGFEVADINGEVEFRFVLPPGFELGTHTATLNGEVSGSVSMEFKVVKPGGVPTGGLVVGHGLLVAILLVLLGVTGVGFRYRTRLAEV